MIPSEGRNGSFIWVGMSQCRKSLCTNVLFSVAVCTVLFSAVTVLPLPYLVGWGRDYRNEGFVDQGGIKFQLVNLITSVQTLLRSKYSVY